MNPRYLLEFLKRRGWLVLLAGLLAAGSSYYFSKQLQPVYRATTTVLVNQQQSQGVIQYNDVLTSERLTSTYAQLAQRRPILADVKQRLSLPLTENQLVNKVSVAPVKDTQLLRISAEDPSPVLAASIANTTARVFIEDNASQLGNRPGQVSIAEEASVPVKPAKPNIMLNTVLAAMLGLMIGAGVGVFVEYLDDTVKSAQDVEQLTGLTTLGTVTRFRNAGRRARKRAVGTVLDQEFAEDFRQIRTNIHFSMLDQGPKTILVTSCYPGEGKTTTAVNLGIVLAQAGHRVILVDTDLRRPSLHRYFGTSNSFGLTGLLLSQSENLDSAFLATGVTGLRLLPSGPLPPNPSEILMSREVRNIVDALKTRADYIILDSPPIMAVTDARLLAGHSDATLLVVEPGRTRSEAFQRARESLGQANAKIIGVVLNKLKTRTQGYYSHGYYRGAPQPSVAIAKEKAPRKERVAAGETPAA